MAMMNGRLSKATELANRATAVGAKLDAIYGRRRELSLAAAEGDRAAAKTHRRFRRRGE